MPTWLNYVVSIAWSYAMLVQVAVVIAGAVLGMRVMTAFPGNGALLLALVYFLMAAIAAWLDRRYEKDSAQSLFWMVWYPLGFWTIQMATAIVGLPRAIRRPLDARGTWVSPDRGFR
jgi:biofilm PGA synthesis N-glycosyltransferase PgaC